MHLVRRLLLPRPHQLGHLRLPLGRIFPLLLPHPSLSLLCRPSGADLIHPPRVALRPFVLVQKLLLAVFFDLVHRVFFLLAPLQLGVFGGLVEKHFFDFSLAWGNIGGGGV